VAGREVSFEQVSLLPRKTTFLVMIVALISALAGVATLVFTSQINSLI
jgi:hypothetical protein